MTQLGELGGRHSHGTGWEFGASSSSCSPPCCQAVSAQPGTAVAFVPRQELLLEHAERCSETGLGLC